MGEKELSAEELAELMRNSSIAGPYDAEKAEELKRRVDADEQSSEDGS